MINEVFELKEFIRARDGYRCTECGMTAEEHYCKWGTTLEIHRKKPGSRYTLDGCITLCNNCHRAKPKSKRYGGPTTSVVLDRETHRMLRQIGAHYNTCKVSKIIHVLAKAETARLAFYQEFQEQEEKAQLKVNKKAKRTRKETKRAKQNPAHQSSTLNGRGPDDQGTRNGDRSQANGSCGAGNSPTPPQGTREEKSEKLPLTS